MPYRHAAALIMLLIASAPHAALAQPLTVEEVEALYASFSRSLVASLDDLEAAVREILECAPPDSYLAESLTGVLEALESVEEGSPEEAEAVDDYLAILLHDLVGLLGEMEECGAEALYRILYYSMLDAEPHGLVDLGSASPGYEEAIQLFVSELDPGIDRASLNEVLSWIAPSPGELALAIIYYYRPLEALEMAASIEGGVEVVASIASPDILASLPAEEYSRVLGAYESRGGMMLVVLDMASRGVSAARLAAARMQALADPMHASVYNSLVVRAECPLVRPQESRGPLALGALESLAILDPCVGDVVVGGSPLASPAVYSYKALSRAPLELEAAILGDAITLTMEALGGPGASLYSGAYDSLLQGLALDRGSPSRWLALAGVVSITVAIAGYYESRDLLVKAFTANPWLPVDPWILAVEMGEAGVRIPPDVLEALRAGRLGEAAYRALTHPSPDVNLLGLALRAAQASIAWARPEAALVEVLEEEYAGLLFGGEDHYEALSNPAEALMEYSQSAASLGYAIRALSTRPYWAGGGASTQIYLPVFEALSLIAGTGVEEGVYPASGSLVEVGWATGLYPGLNLSSVIGAVEEALGIAGQGEAGQVAKLLEAYESYLNASTEAGRAEALEALRDVMLQLDPQDLERILSLLEAVDPYAAEALRLSLEDISSIIGFSGQEGVEVDVDSILQLLERGDYEGVADALESMDPEALSRLLEVLGEIDPEAYGEIMSIIGSDPELVDRLASSLDSPSIDGLPGASISLPGIPQLQAPGAPEAGAGVLAGLSLAVLAAALAIAARRAGLYGAFRAAARSTIVSVRASSLRAGDLDARRRIIEIYRGVLEAYKPYYGAKGASETHWEYGYRLDTRDRGPYEAIARVYEKAKFSSHPIDESDVESVAKAVREARRRLLERAKPGGAGG